MDLVIDHSVQVDVARQENAVQVNMDREFQRNKERFAFLKWGSTAFHNMLVVPPGSGIVHQVQVFARYSNHLIIMCELIFCSLDSRFLLALLTLILARILCLLGLP